MKKKWLLIIVFIVVFALILVGYILSTTLILTENVCKADIIIGAIGEGVSFIGTISLGVVAYWQTKTANDISQAQLRRELITNISLQSKTNIKALDLKVKKMLTQFREIPQEGIYCSTETLDNIKEDEERKFFEFSFQFKTEGAPLEAIYPKELKINRELSKDYSQYIVDFQILNQRKDAVFVYDPEEGNYVIKVLLNAPIETLDKIAAEKMFVLDIIFDVVSIYGTIQKNHWSINFDQEIIEITKLKDGTLPNQNINLKNVIIHKGEAKYERQ